MSAIVDILSRLRSLGAGAVDLLLPGTCMACRAEEATTENLCQACNLRLLALVALPYCRRCGAGLSGGLPAAESCRACPSTLPRYDCVIRLGPYEDPLRIIVRQLKYHRQEALRGHLGRLLGAAVAARCEVPLDLVLSVPMHWRRRLARGYDHALVLAKAVAGELDLPVGNELLRVRHTPPQAHLTRTRRIENVRGAFDVRRGAALAGAKVLLVDDVTTTGATANEAARGLLRAGASSVTLAAVAKAEPPAAYSERRTDHV